MTSTIDEEQTDGTAHFVGLHEGKPVLPNGTAHLVCRKPSLRNEVDHVGRVTLTLNGARKAERIIGVRRLHVPIERGAFARGGAVLRGRKGGQGETECNQASRNP